MSAPITERLLRTSYFRNEWHEPSGEIEVSVFADMAGEDGVFERPVNPDGPEAAAIIKELTAALEPFARIGEHDVGADEHDADQFRPMSSRHNRAPLLTVGDLRKARLAIAKARNTTLTTDGSES